MTRAALEEARQRLEVRAVESQLRHLEAERARLVLAIQLAREAAAAAVSQALHETFAPARRLTVWCDN